jgi:hypothetical protein
MMRQYFAFIWGWCILGVEVCSLMEQCNTPGRAGCDVPEIVKTWYGHLKSLISECAESFFINLREKGLKHAKGEDLWRNLWKTLAVTLWLPFNCFPVCRGLCLLWPTRNPRKRTSQVLPSGKNDVPGNYIFLFSTSRVKWRKTINSGKY